MSQTQGLGLLGWVGALLATYMSWTHWHSVFYAALHFCCGWLYVIYALIRYGVPH